MKDILLSSGVIFFAAILSSHEAKAANIIPIISSLLLDDAKTVENCIDISGEWVISNSTPEENWENTDQLTLVKENGCDFKGYADWDTSNEWPVFFSINGTMIQFHWKIEEETINATGTIIGDTMGGTYTVTGGPDDGEVGEWKAKKGELGSF